MQGPRDVLQPPRLLLAWLLLDWHFVAIRGVNQSQIVFRIERVTMSGLLPRGAQGDVHAPVVGQNHYAQIVQHLLSVAWGQVGIFRYLLFHLFRVQIFVFAE